MQNKLEGKYEDYFPISHKEWCNPMSAIDVKDNITRAAVQIKRLATPNSAPVNSERDYYIRVPRKNNSRTGVLPSHKHYGENIPKHNGMQSY